VRVISRYALFLQQRNRFDAVELMEALLGDERLNVVQQGQVYGLLATAYSGAGRHDEAQRAIGRALEIADYGDDELRARTFSRAAGVAFYDSDEEKLESYAREGIRLATEIGAFGLAARLCATLQSMHALAGRTPSAIWFATQAEAHAEKAGDPYMRAYGLRALLQMEAERGNAERIAEIERELTSVSYRGPVALYGQLVGRTIALVWESKFAEAKSVIATSAEGELLPSQNRVRLALLACVCAAAGDAGGATAAISAYEAAIESDTDARPIYDRQRALSERFGILASVLVGRNAAAGRMLRSIRHRRDDFVAFDATLHALQSRAPEALDEALREMRLAGHGGFARFVEVVAAHRTSQSPVASTDGLTTAEVQTLRGLCLGLSNQAIADEQGRAVNTVRTHVSSVLRKLGAASRGEAVAMARRRGLV